MRNLRGIGVLFSNPNNQREKKKERGRSDHETICDSLAKRENTLFCCDIKVNSNVQEKRCMALDGNLGDGRKGRTLKIQQIGIAIDPIPALRALLRDWARGRNISI